MTAAEDMDRRLDLFHETLNDRLQIKDRWISDRLDELEKRIDIQINDVYRHTEGEFASLLRLLEAQQQRSEERSEARYIELKTLLLAEQTKRDQLGQLLLASNKDIRELEQTSLDQFKSSTQQRLEAVVKATDVLREERALFVLRDAHETQLDALEKNMNTLERTLIEKAESLTAQVRETFDARVQTNTDRLIKMEQNLQVMNARNQQSIIALGILLTLVEIIIRFYQT